MRYFILQTSCEIARVIITIYALHRDISIVQIAITQFVKNMLINRACLEVPFDCLDSARHAVFALMFYAKNNRVRDRSEFMRKRDVGNDRSDRRVYQDDLRRSHRVTPNRPCNFHSIGRGKNGRREEKKGGGCTASGMREMPCVTARMRDRNVSGRDSCSRRFPLAGNEDARQDQASRAKTYACEHTAISQPDETLKGQMH